MDRTTVLLRCRIWARTMQSDKSRAFRVRASVRHRAQVDSTRNSWTHRCLLMHWNCRVVSLFSQYTTNCCKISLIWPDFTLSISIRQATIPFIAAWRSHQRHRHNRSTAISCHHQKFIDTSELANDCSLLEWLEHVAAAQGELSPSILLASFHTRWTHFTSHLYLSHRFFVALASTRIRMWHEVDCVFAFVRSSSTL